jgi:hypothetical protein
MLEALFIDLVTITVVSGFVWFLVNGYVAREHPRLLKPIGYYFLSMAITIFTLVALILITQW